jgi:hypothetical protein
MCVKSNWCSLLECFLSQDIKRSVVSLEHDVGHSGPSRLILVSPVDVPEAFNALCCIALLPTSELFSVLG